MHPWAVAYVRISQELVFASLAFPLANAAATSTALWPSARFEALVHSRSHHLVTRAANSRGFGRLPVHLEVFLSRLAPKGGSEYVGR